MRRIRPCPLVARVVAAVRTIADAFVIPGEAALIVTHGGALRALLRDVSGLGVESIPNGAVFRVECHGSAFVRPELVEAPTLG